MSNYAIRIENLGKLYKIGKYQGRYRSLRESLQGALTAPIRRLRSSLSSEEKLIQENSIWALKDVSFEIEHGDVVGIIGRNGAGKSTLLKILARITEPTAGAVRLRGRVGSLLEVGTGFHPELTGRENIFLNGAILGMSRKEIQRKFDEIVDFAEVEQFIDTPAKHYSSGMYMRLAFAVAAHLEPEILLVDEVLAVGDAEFQKKCLGKMGEVAKEGRTILFVSHNMAAILNLCPKSILIEKGKLAIFENSRSVVGKYNSNKVENVSENLNQYRPAGMMPLIQMLKLYGDDGTARSTFPLGSNINLDVQFQMPENVSLSKPVLGVVIKNDIYGTVGGVNMRMTGYKYPKKEYNSAIIKCRLSNIPLLQGEYSVDLWLGDDLSDLDAIFGYLHFSINETDLYGSGKLPHAQLGVIYFNPQWEIISL